MTPTRAWNDLLSALGLLTRLPLPAHDARGASAAWAYPLAGLVIALIAGLAGFVALCLSLPPQAAALLALATSIALTGALHEDGLADMADGFWGATTRERRLEIMKDSRIGSYGVLALGLSLIARWTALTALFDHHGALWAMIAAMALSRAAMPALMAALPHARPDGLSRSVGVPPTRTALHGALIAAVLAYLCLGWGGSAAILVTALVAAGTARLAARKIGGQTGDVLGAAQQLTEIAVLFVAIA